MISRISCRMFVAQASLLRWAMALVVAPSQDVVPRRLVPFRRATLVRLSYSNYDDPFSPADGIDRSSPWTQEEEWSLMDGVRTFSIGGDERMDRYTFWERMVRESPELSKRSAKEARERFGTMRSDNATHLEAGPSPPLLHDWWVQGGDVRGGGGSVVGMGGTLDDGRIVWFPLQGLGRFDGHVLDSFGPAPPTVASAAVPGGYAEASGGRVYELGIPRATTRAETAPLAPEQEGGMSLFFRQTATASLAALAAVALLSVAVGYGAGLGVSQELGGPVQTAEVYGNFGMTVPAAKAMAAPSTRVEQSISEMRARQEVRVLKEKRIIRAVEERLDTNERILEELRQLERKSMRIGTESTGSGHSSL